MLGFAKIKRLSPEPILLATFETIFYIIVPNLWFCTSNSLLFLKPFFYSFFFFDGIFFTLITDLINRKYIVQPWLMAISEFILYAFSLVCHLLFDVKSSSIANVWISTLCMFSFLEAFLFGYQNLYCYCYLFLVKRISYTLSSTPT